MAMARQVTSGERVGRTRRADAGFTLMELLVALTIFAALSALAGQSIWLLVRSYDQFMAHSDVAREQVLATRALLNCSEAGPDDRAVDHGARTDVTPAQLSFLANAQHETDYQLEMLGGGQYARLVLATETGLPSVRANQTILVTEPRDCRYDPVGRRCLPREAG